jgi:type III secretory pathway component EscT
MGKIAIACANIIVMQYFLTSHYAVPNKWAWLGLTAVVLGVLLGVFASRRGKE